VIGGRVLDAAAIGDIVIGRTVYGGAFVRASQQVGITLVLPAVALQEAWMACREKDWPFLELLIDLPVTLVHPLDGSGAERSALIARASSPRPKQGKHQARPVWDASAAHAVLVARDRGWPVLTGDVRRIRALDATIPVETLPAP
jgi:hypothetical protein